MVGVGFLVLVGGYGLFAYGWGQLHGCNAGIADVFWPGKFTGCHPDKGSSGPSSPAPPGSGVKHFRTKKECAAYQAVHGGICAGSPGSGYDWGVPG